jgi:integrase
MGRKTMSGLVNRKGVWHIDKVVRGRRICESSGTSDIEEAERYLAHRMEEIRQAEVYGVRPKRTFRKAATKYLNEKEKSSLDKDAWALKRIDPFIGSLRLEQVHMGTLRPYIEHGRVNGLKNRTINMPLEVVRHILNLAASEWLDENGLTWLQHAPKIRLLPRTDAREPYPLTWEEQDRLFAELPDYLREMCLFNVNTGCRDREVCGLRWEWEEQVTELGASVFIIPKENVKNRQDRLVVLNMVALQVINRQRGKHPEWVFAYEGKTKNKSEPGPIWSMNTTAFKKARNRAGLPHVRIHDLKHTFGRRLRGAGVSYEDRQDLLGHKSGRITTHYSMPELENLITAANAVCGNGSRKSPASSFLRKKSHLQVVSNQAG